MTTSDEDHKGEEGKPKKESTTEKRKEAPNHDDCDFSPHAVDEDSVTATSNFVDMSRSERKRDREKKRRSDVNRGLDELMALVFLIDPELKAEAEERRRKSHSNRILHTTELEAMLSRVELINSAVIIMKRIHRENEERKVVISHLSMGLLAARSGSAGQQALPPSFAAAYPYHVARPTDMQVISFHRVYVFNISDLASLPVSSASTFSQPSLGLQQQLNAALAASIAGAGIAGASLRQPLPNDTISMLQESLARGATPSGIMGTRPRNPMSAEAILGRIQNATVGLPSEQDDFGAYYRALLQRGMLNGESAGAVQAGNALSNMLGESAVPAPLLSRSADYNSMLQLSSEHLHQAMNREAMNREAAKKNFGSPSGRRHY